MKAEHARALAVIEAGSRRRNLSPDRTAALLRTARLFLAGLGRPLRALDASETRAFLAARAEVLAPSTHVDEASRLRGLLRALHDEGLVRVDLAPSIVVAAPPRPARLLLSPDTVRHLLATSLLAVPRQGGVAAALRDRATLELLYGTGLRAAEVRAVRVVDVDLAGATLRVRAVKRGTDRTLPLPPATVEHLRRYLVDARPALVHRARRDPGHLLLTNTGTPLYRQAVWRLVGRVASKAGLRASPHAFRRALATHLVRAGASVPAVSELLGHARLDSSAAYVEVDREDLRRAVALLDESMPGRQARCEHASRSPARVPS